MSNPAADPRTLEQLRATFDAHFNSAPSEELRRQIRHQTEAIVRSLAVK